MRKINLFRYQNDSIRQALVRERLLMLIDAGLGKTIVGLSLLKILKGMNPNLKALILTKKVLINNAWLHDNSDIANFGLDIHKAKVRQRTVTKRGRKRVERYLDVNEGKGIVIMNYEKYEARYGELRNLEWDVVICDESKSLAGRSSKITRKMYNIKANRMYLLTAYPAPNHRDQFYPQLRLCGYNVWWKDMANTFFYQPAPNKIPGWYVFDQKKENEFNELVSQYSIVYTKDDPLVMKELKFGDKLKLNYYIDPPPKLLKISEELLKHGVYESSKGDVVAWYNLTESLHLKKLSAGIIEYESGEIEYNNFRNKRIAELVEQIDRPVIIYYTYNHERDGMIDEFKSRFGRKFKSKVRLLNGEIKDRDKDRNIAWFKKANGNEVLIAQYKAMKYGLSFNNCKYMIFYMPPSDAEDILQAQDRIHRVFQEEDVTYYTVICRNMIDEPMKAAFDNKENIDNAIKKYVRKRRDEILRSSAEVSSS